MKLLVTLLVLVFSVSALGLDENLAKERRCLNLATTTDIDYAWISSIEEWYFPIVSKLDLYRVASDMLNKPVADIPESVLENACGVCNSEFKCTGFDQPVTDFDTSSDSSGVITFKAKDRKHAIGGKHTVTFTDNKNFVVGITCFDDDEAAYEIWTPKPFISDRNKELIKNHLVDLGFNMDYLIELPYDNCNVHHAAKTEL